MLRTDFTDPPMARIEAAWLTELALGEDRRDTAFRLIVASLNVLTDDRGTAAADLAEQLRDMADDLDAMVTS
jgi:hypothetical protein